MVACEVCAVTAQGLVWLCLIAWSCALWAFIVGTGVFACAVLVWFTVLCLCSVLAGEV